MIFFYRTIANTDIGITINKIMYQSNPCVFEAIFHTYDLSNEHQFLQSSNHIYIDSKEHSDCNIMENCFYHRCFTDSSNWVTYLIAFLESCYEKIVSCTVFHGSCIEFNNKSFLILGNSKTGKSTLTYYLIQNRQVYYIDDDMVYSSNGKFFGFGTPISLRNMERGNPNLIETNFGIDKIPRYIYKIPANKTKPYIMNINFILFPDYSSNLSLQAHKLTGYELINKIFTNVRGTANMKHTFKEITSLLLTAQAFQLRYGSSEDVVKFIDNLVS